MMGEWRGTSDFTWGSSSPSEWGLQSTAPPQGRVSSRLPEDPEPASDSSVEASLGQIPAEALCDHSLCWCS